MGRSSALVASEHLRFVGDHLEATDEAVKAIDRPKLSASTADAMKGCHARFAADKILPRDEDPFSPAPLGTAAHEVLENLMLLPPAERTERNAMRMLLADAKKMWPAGEDGEPHPDEKRWRKEVWNKVTGLWEIEDPTEVNVVATEWRLDGVEIEGVPFVGYIDRTDRDDDEALRVLDYKSGKGKGLDRDGLRKLQRFGDSHGDQIRLYKLGLEQIAGEEVASGSIYYIGEGQARDVSMATAHLDRVKRDFSNAWVELKADVAAGAFPTKPGPLCGWCPLVNICPSAQLDGRSAKIDVPSPEELGIEVVSRLVSPAHPVSDQLDQADPMEDDIMAINDYDPFEDFATPVKKSAPVRDEPEFEEEPAPAKRTKAVKAAAASDEAELLFGEDKTWIPTVGRGIPNGNSYGAAGAFGLADLAISQLTKAGARPRTSDIVALAKTFGLIVADAQEAMSGSRDPNDGVATRMRGALRTTLENEPAPIGKTAAEWEIWRDRATRRCIVMGRVAHALLTELDSDDEPYLALAIDEEDEAA